MSCCALATHSSTQQYRCLLVIYFYAAAKDVGWRNNAFGWFVCMCLPLLHFYEMQGKKNLVDIYLHQGHRCCFSVGLVVHKVLITF